ncbi:hypothetical protein AAV35_002560 [Salimicrobium jeotgali]|uniref:Uncharacterized protein n=1 Tax=Salimicrobium jeotgali TaxID=1230341 RepID=K2G7X8_9BACI|nr:MULTISPECIES: hypothetical protein [Salimicrobium]AKG03780.1 hypothetical protein AAV35_002560 [Salimicrobium jeotgali]EKE31263.1 hypothetical protein MJ3_09163 [Salimicrobium jeotgali]
MILIFTKKRYLRFPLADTFIDIEVLGENYFYARSVFYHMPYQVEGKDLNKVLATILRRIISDNRDLFTN